MMNLTDIKKQIELAKLKKSKLQREKLEQEKKNKKKIKRLKLNLKFEVSEIEGRKCGVINVILKDKKRELKKVFNKLYLEFQEKVGIYLFVQISIVCIMFWIPVFT